MSHYLFQHRDGQTILSKEAKKGLKIKSVITRGDLDEFEAKNMQKGQMWLQKQKETGLNYEFWLKLHKRLLQDVWKWAGKVREHQLHNPDFNEPYEIWPNLYRLEQDLDFWIKNKTYPVKEIMALFHEKLLTIHPFYDGNGRFSRILIEHICRRLDIYVPTWGRKYKSDEEARRYYISAIENSRKRNSTSDLVEFMFE